MQASKKTSFISISLLLLFFSANTAQAGKPPLTVSDLDAPIGNLPLKSTKDPVQTLVGRLDELDKNNAECLEKDALEQVVSIIKILRATRISCEPEPPTDTRLLAVTIRNKARSGYHRGK